MKTRINNKKRQTHEFNSLNKFGYLAPKIFHLIKKQGFIFNPESGYFINGKITLTIFKNSNENTYFARVCSDYDGAAHFYAGSASPHSIMQISKLLALIQFTEPNFQTEIIPQISKKRPNIELTQTQDYWEVSDWTTATYLRIPQKYGTKILSKIWIAFNKMT